MKILDNITKDDIRLQIKALMKTREEYDSGGHKSTCEMCLAVKSIRSGHNASLSNWGCIYCPWLWIVGKSCGEWIRASKFSGEYWNHPSKSLASYRIIRITNWIKRLRKLL